MKKIKILSVLAALFMLLPAFVSCDKDDDTPAVADSILGTYSGSLGYNVIGFDPGTIDGTYDLKIMKDASDPDDVTVVIPQCSYTPPIPNASAFTIPSLTVNDVDVTEKGGKYSISEDDFALQVGDVTYTGKLSGTVEGGNIKLDYVVRPGKMKMDINFTFTGILK